MTSTDFDTILIESIIHQTKESFFENKRKANSCTKQEYIAGLKDSFKRLGEVISGPHCYHINDNGMLYDPFHPHGTFDTNNDFEIGFNLDLDGKTIRIYVVDEQMPDILKSIEDYFQWISDKQLKKKKAEDLPDLIVKYLKLFEAMKPYISGISLFEFSNIIMHNCLSPGTPLAKWEGEKVDACYFADYFKMTNPQWNKCFHFEDNKPLHKKYADKLDKGSPVRDLLLKYLPR